MKAKTKKIVAKRFRVTKSGKVLRRTQGARHLRRKKKKCRQRRQDRTATVANPIFKKMIKRFLPN